MSTWGHIHYYALLHLLWIYCRMFSVMSHCQMNVSVQRLSTSSTFIGLKDLFNFIDVCHTLTLAVSLKNKYWIHHPQNGSREQMRRLHDKNDLLFDIFFQRRILNKFKTEKLWCFFILQYLSMIADE